MSTLLKKILWRAGQLYSTTWNGKWRKQNFLLNTLEQGEKKHINSFQKPLTATKEKEQKRKIRTEKDIKVSHRYPDYIHRKIWGTLEIINWEFSGDWM